MNGSGRAAPLPGADDTRAGHTILQRASIGAEEHRQESRAGGQRATATHPHARSSAPVASTRW